MAVASLAEADQPARGAALHINVESKARWYEIRDGMPQHAAMPPGAKQAMEQ